MNSRAFCLCSMSKPECHKHCNNCKCCPVTLFELSDHCMQLFGFLGLYNWKTNFKSFHNSPNTSLQQNNRLYKMVLFLDTSCGQNWPKTCRFHPLHSKARQTICIWVCMTKNRLSIPIIFPTVLQDLAAATFANLWPNLARGHIERSCQKNTLFQKQVFLPSSTGRGQLCYPAEFGNRESPSPYRLQP